MSKMINVNNRYQYIWILDKRDEDWNKLIWHRKDVDKLLLMKLSKDM